MTTTIPETVANLRRFHQTGATRPADFRRRQLEALRETITRHEKDLLEALRADLGKREIEAYASEIGFVQSDIRHALRHLKRWMRPQRRRVPLIAWPGSGQVVPEPLGLALIIGPWNYPFQLMFSPLVGAIAAGNCVCLKPSEFAPATSAAVARLVADAFPSGLVSVVEGEKEVAQALLDLPFDHIFFTGSESVGRAVMKAAAKQLTPVTLELGGKSPCIVCGDADIDVAARRTMWGKCLNAGQTCIAPDYLLVERSIATEFTDALRQATVQFYGENPRQSAHYGRVVNARHFERLTAYLQQGRVVFGGDHDAEDLYIAPTLLADVDPQAPVMQEEVFGPILPVIEFNDLDEALQLVAERPDPLALYVFTADRDVQAQVLAHTRSGGVCINDVVTHILPKEMPFGGVGASGMGAYHGKASFDCFTHYRSVMRRSTRVDLPFRYPRDNMTLKMLKRIYGFLVRR